MKRFSKGCDWVETDKSRKSKSERDTEKCARVTRIYVEPLQTFFVCINTNIKNSKPHFPSLTKFFHLYVDIPWKKTQIYCFVWNKLIPARGHQFKRSLRTNAKNLQESYVWIRSSLAHNSLICMQTQRRHPTKERTDQWVTCDKTEPY